MVIFNKSHLSLVPKLKTKRVTVGDLEFILQAFTAGEQDDYEASLVMGKGKNRDVNLKDLRAKLVAPAIIDEEGNKVFTPADVGIVSSWPSDVVDPLYKEVVALNRMEQKGEGDEGK